MRLSYTTINLIFLFILSQILCLLTFHAGFNIDIFTESNDVFYYQIVNVRQEVEHSLKLYHLFRYYVVAPFLFIEEKMGSLFLHVVIFSINYFSIVILWKYFNHLSIFFIPFLLVPCFISFRSTLCMFAISIYFLSNMVEYKPLKLLAIFTSMLFANLSSGVLLLIIIFVGYEFYYRWKVITLSFLSLSLLTMTPMFIQKWMFFSDYGNPFLVMASRSNLFSSFNEDKIKFIFYIALTTLYISTFIWSVVKKGKGVKLYLFLASISVIFLEGLGALSLLLFVGFYLASRFYIQKRESSGEYNRICSQAGKTHKDPRYTWAGD